MLERLREGLKLEIAAFFTEGVPARKWKTHVFAGIEHGGKDALDVEEKTNVHHVEVGDAA